MIDIFLFKRNIIFWNQLLREGMLKWNKNDENGVFIQISLTQVSSGKLCPVKRADKHLLSLENEERMWMSSQKRYQRNLNDEQRLWKPLGNIITSPDKKWLVNESQWTLSLQNLSCVTISPQKGRLQRRNNNRQRT